jgi:hypothetical protein
MEKEERQGGEGVGENVVFSHHLQKRSISGYYGV